MRRDRTYSPRIEQHDRKPRRSSAVEIVRLIVADNEHLGGWQINRSRHRGEEPRRRFLPADFRADHDVADGLQVRHRLYQAVQPMVEVGADAKSETALRQG